MIPLGNSVADLMLEGQGSYARVWGDWVCIGGCELMVHAKHLVELLSGKLRHLLHIKDALVLRHQRSARLHHALLRVLDVAIDRLELLVIRALGIEHRDDGIVENGVGVVARSSERLGRFLEVADVASVVLAATLLVVRIDDVVQRTTEVAGAEAL